MDPVLFAFLLCQNLLQPRKTGKRVLSGSLGLTLDQGQGVVDIILGDPVTLFVDPLQRHLLLEVCHIGEVEQLGLAGIHTALATAASTAVLPARKDSSMSVREAT